MLKKYLSFLCLVVDSQKKKRKLSLIMKKLLWWMEMPTKDAKRQLEKNLKWQQIRGKHDMQRT